MDEIQKIEGTPDYIACKIVCDFSEQLDSGFYLDFHPPGEQSVWVGASYIDTSNDKKPRILVDGVKEFGREKWEAVRAFLKEVLGAENLTFPKGGVNPLCYVITGQVRDKAKQQLQSVCPQKHAHAASQEQGEVKWDDGDRYPRIVQ